MERKAAFGWKATGWLAGVAVLGVAVLAVAQGSDENCDATVAVDGDEHAGEADGTVLSDAWAWVWWCVLWGSTVAWVLVTTILTYVALPWLLVPGVIIDLPLRLLLYVCLPAELSGSALAEAGFGIVPDWAIFLFIRCAVVQILSPHFSPRLAQMLSPILSSVAAPFLAKENALTQVFARPLDGTLNLSVKADPATALALAGFANTSLLFTAVEVDVAVFITPFCPFWRVGARIDSIRIEGCCREYRRSRTAEEVVVTHNVIITLAAEAFVHTWAGAMLFVPSLPPLRPLFTPTPPFVTARVDPVRLMISNVAEEGSGENLTEVELLLGPTCLSVTEASGLHPEFVLPIFESLKLSMEVGTLHCRLRVLRNDRFEISDVMWTGLSVWRNQENVSDSREPPASLPDGKLETEIGDSIVVTAPLLKLTVKIQRGVAVMVDGKIERLWLRTNFRALQVLLMVAMPTTLPPLGNDALDRRLRRLYTRSKSKVELDAVLSGDKELEKILLSTTPRNPRGLNDREYNRGYVHGDATSSPRWDALDEVQRLMKLRGAGINRSPELAELHLGFMPLRERVNQAIYTFLGKREVDKICASAGTGAAAERGRAGSGPAKPAGGTINMSAGLSLDQQAYQQVNKALSHKTPIARADVKAALEADPLLCYILDQTVYCLDNGVRCIVNKIKQAGGFTSWVDNIFATLDAADGPLDGLDGVWDIITGAIVEPLAYTEPEEFLVEVTRHIDGFQGIVQAFVGGPLLAAVKCKPTDTIEMLRAKIGAEVGLPLNSVQLRIPYDDSNQWDTWATRPEQTLKEAANGAPFPRQLLLQQPLTVFAEALRSVVKTRILFHVDVQISLPAAVVAPLDHASSAHRLAAEIVCECGHGRIFTGDGRGSGEGEQGVYEKGDKLDEKLSKINLVIANGQIHDDEGLFHDTIEVLLSGFRCYILWTPEGLMAQLDEDTNGELSVAELSQALRLYDTSVTAEMIDTDGDGTITTEEMEVFLHGHPDLMAKMCTSALVEETAFEIRLGQSFLTGAMLRHRHCQGFPRSRVELAVAPINIVLDMRDMAIINRVTASASKGFETIFPVDHLLEVTDAASTPQATQPASVDPCDSAATEFNVIIGRKQPKARGEFGEELDGSIPCGPLPISISVRRAGVSILNFSAQLRLDVLRKTLGVLRVRGDIKLFGSCENEERGCWEPWLEPWTVFFSYTSADIVLGERQEEAFVEHEEQQYRRDRTVSPELQAQLDSHTSPNVRRQDSVEVPVDEMTTTTEETELCAPEVCTLNVSYSLMRDLLEISALLAESSAEEQSVVFKRRKRRVDLAHSPFIFYNDTGSPLDYYISNGSEGQVRRPIDSYDKTWLKAEDMQSISIADMQSAASTNGDNEEHDTVPVHQLHVRNIGVEGWDGTPEGFGTYENEHALHKIFAQYGTCESIVIRRRIVHQPGTPSPNTPQAHDMMTASPGSAAPTFMNRSWALVNMGDEQSLQRALDAPKVMAGDTELRVERCNSKNHGTPGRRLKEAQVKRRWTSIHKHLPVTSKTMLSAMVNFGRGPDIAVPGIRQIGARDLLPGNDRILLRDPVLGDHVVEDLMSFVEIDPNSGHKTVSLRSSVRLQNKTDVDLIAQIKVDKPKEIGSGEFPLPAGTARSVPIKMVGRNMAVRVRPISKEMCSAKENEYRTGTGIPTDQSIKWSEFISIAPEHRTVGNPYRDVGIDADAIQVTVPCPHFSNEPDLSKEPESDLKFHCHAVWCELDKALTAGHRATKMGTLAFIPFMTIVNELPCTARLQVLLHTIDADSVPQNNDDSEGNKGSPRDPNRSSPGSKTSPPTVSSESGRQPVKSLDSVSRWRATAKATSLVQLSKKSKTRQGSFRFNGAHGSFGHERFTCELESGETIEIPCLGRWSGSVTVATTITHVDLLYPPTAAKLRGMFEDMDVDMDGTLSAREIENSWDKIEGLDAIFQELLMYEYGVVMLPPKPDGTANVFSYTLPPYDGLAANRAQTRNGDVFVIVNHSRADDQLEGYPIGHPELKGLIPSYLVELMNRGDEIKTFLAGTPDNWDKPLTMEEFLSCFRFPEGSANVAKELDYHMIYHQHVCSPKIRVNNKAQKTVPKQLQAAWKPLDEYNATPLMLPLERMKRGMSEPMNEGLLCLKFHFSLNPGDSVEVHLFSSHWLVNRGLTPLVAHIGNPVDQDAALSGSAVSGVIGGADIAVRSALKGVTGIVTKPIEGLQEKGVSGLFSGIGSGLYGAVVDPVTGVIKATTNVVSGTLTSAQGVVGGTISGVTGVFTKPIEGARDDGFAGFATGVGKGLMGAIMAPTRQVLETALGDTAEAALEKTGQMRDRAVGLASGRSLIKFKSNGPDRDGCWGPVSMGQMIPAKGEQPMKTVAVSGYQLLGVDPTMDSICLQLRLPNNDIYAGLAPIKDATWPDPITRRLPESQLVELNLPEQFKGMTLPVQVSVRQALPPFINSQIVSINSPWTIHNASSYNVHVRASCGQYEVMKDIQIAHPDGTPAVLLRLGDRLEAIGLMHIGKTFSKNLAVCFMRGGSAHWCEIKKDGEHLLRRTDMPVLARYEVIADEVPLHSSAGAMRSTTGQTLPRGTVVEALKIVKGSRSRSYWIEIDHRSTGETAWLKLSSKGVDQLVEVFDDPREHTHLFTKAHLQMHDPQTQGRFGLQPGVSSYHFDAEHPGVSAELYQTIEASDSSPLLLYTSAAEHVFMRVAVASHDFEEPLLWSQCLTLDDSEGTTQPMEMTFSVRVPADVADGYVTKHISGHITEPGVLVLRDALEPPYIVRNGTSQPVDYRIVPSSQPWWTTVEPGGESHVWQALQVNANGVVKVKGRKDERKFGDQVKICFREPGDDRVSGGPLQPDLREHGATRSPRDGAQAPAASEQHHSHFTFDLGQHTAICELHGRTIDSSVDLCDGGSVVFKIWETGQSKAIAPPPRTSMDIRLQGIHACFIDRNQTEWARLAVDCIRTSSMPVGVLYASILSATDLVQADFVGANDAKATVEVVGEHRETGVQKSHTPQWFEDHEASAPPESFQFSFAARQTDALIVKVWDEDMFSADDLLGYASINISEVAAAGDKGLKLTQSLRVPAEMSKSKSPRYRGSVVLRLRYESCPYRQPQMDELSIGRVLFGGAHAPQDQVTVKDGSPKRKGGKNAPQAATATANATASSDKPFHGGTNSTNPKPQLPILTMQYGFQMIKKSSDSSGTQIKALVFQPNEVVIKLDADFFVNATGFAASLLPLLESGSKVQAAVAALQYNATVDVQLTANTEAQEIKCERPEVIRVLPAHVQVGLDLDEYITELGQLDADSGEANRSTNSARALAGFIGFDLQSLLNMPGMTIVKAVINHFVDTVLEAKLDDLKLPVAGIRMTPAAFETAYMGYMMNQVMQLVYQVLPNPGLFISRKGLEVIQAGGAIIDSKSQEEEKARREEQQEELKVAQTFVKPGRSFGPVGQLLPIVNWAEATALDDHQLNGYADIHTVLLISTSRPRAQLVAAAARSHASKGVLPILYDEDWDSPAEIVDRLKHTLLSVNEHRTTFQLTDTITTPGGRPRQSVILDVLKRWQGSDTLHTIAVMANLEPDRKPASYASESLNALGGLIVGNTRFRATAGLRKAATCNFWTDLGSLLPYEDGRMLLFMCQGAQEAGQNGGFSRLQDTSIGQLHAHFEQPLHISIVPRAPQLAPDTLTGACIRLLDPAVFYLWVDGAKRALGNAHAAAATRLSANCDGFVEVICSGTLDVETEVQAQASSWSCSARALPRIKWTTSEFQLDAEGRLQWTQFRLSPTAENDGTNRSGSMVLPNDGRNATVQVHDDATYTWKTEVGDPSLAGSFPGRFDHESVSKKKHRAEEIPPNCFALTVGKQSVLMHAAAASDRYRWVEALKSEINDRLRSADQNLDCSRRSSPRDLRPSPGGSCDSERGFFARSGGRSGMAAHAPPGGRPLSSSATMTPSSQRGGQREDGRAEGLRRSSSVRLSPMT